MNYKQLNTLIKLGRDFGHEQIRGAGFTDTEHAICTFLCFSRPRFAGIPSPPR